MYMFNLFIDIIYTGCNETIDPPPRKYKINDPITSHFECATFIVSLRATAFMLFNYPSISVSFIGITTLPEVSTRKYILKWKYAHESHIFAQKSEFRNNKISNSKTFSTKWRTSKFSFDIWQVFKYQYHRSILRRGGQ